jgi:DNA-binding transcriptional MerR regulator
MGLKMSRLVQLSDTPKSTILYYIKEGLLPEPEKIKPNVHLYPEDFVERIRFIRYLQHHFNASIDQIRDLLRHGDFDFSRGFEAVLENLEALMAPASGVVMGKEEACERLGVPCPTLERWIAMGALFEREGGFGEKEIEMIRILKALETLDPEETLLKHYVACARELSRKESDFARKVLAAAKDRNETAKTLFDAALLLKPYLFDMHLAHTFRSGEGA